MKLKEVVVKVIIAFASLLLIALLVGTIYGQIQVSDITQKVDEASMTIDTLGKKIADSDLTISSLTSQLNDAKTRLASQDKILNLQESQNIKESYTVNQSSGQSSLIANFNAQYAGYVTISGTSTTTNGYIQVVGSGFSSQYEFGTGATLKIPILPGQIAVYFGNSNFMNGATATISVIYWY